MADGTIKVCIDKVLPLERAIEAAGRSVEENPANAPILRPRPGLGVDPFSRPRAAIETAKRWEKGRTLRVGFLEGDPAVQRKVEAYARQWSQHANIAFAFGGAADADIRIAFDSNDGSWSWIGTDAIVIPPGQATMNFGWLTPTSADDEYSRVVLHEFGHALGLIHEHSSPAAGIPWNREAVYRYYMGHGWTREDVDFNLFQKYDRSVTQFTAFDPKSIMLYPIPRELTIGGFETTSNRALSATDIAFIGQQYPFDAKPVVDLKVGARSVEGSIDEAGEEHLFRFLVREEGAYTVKTTGRTDVRMGLYGPDSQVVQIAEDDDSGWRENAKIVAALRPGTYYLKVSHVHPTGLGKYRVTVRAGG